MSGPYQSCQPHFEQLLFFLPLTVQNHLCSDTQCCLITQCLNFCCLIFPENFAIFTFSFRWIKPLNSSTNSRKPFVITVPPTPLPYTHTHTSIIVFITVTDPEPQSFWVFLSVYVLSQTSFFRNSPVAEQVKYSALSLKWLGSLLWHRFNPWPRNFHMPCMWPKNKKK